LIDISLCGFDRFHNNLYLCGFVVQYVLEILIFKNLYVLIFAKLAHIRL